MADTLRVFVSSSHSELRNERVTIRDLLRSLDIDVFLYEDDAGARTEAPQEIYKDEVIKSHIYVGIFKEKYSAPTIEEYRLATQSCKDILIYISPVEKKDEQLDSFLKEIAPRHGYQKFEDVSELQKLFKRDILNLLKRHYKLSNEQPHVSNQSNILTNDTRLRQYIGRVMDTAEPDSLQDFLKDMNSVASEIIAVWNAMGYIMKNFEVLDDMIDFEGEVSRWPKDNVLIRCVDGEVTSLHVENMHQKMNKRPGYRGYIFTYSRILGSARMTALKYQELKVMTQTEFYRSLMNPEKYFNYLKDYYDSHNISEYYVNPDCYQETLSDIDGTYTHEKLGDLNTYVDSWVKDKNQKHLSILGEFGSGKTWFCWRYAMKCLDEYIRDPNAARLPILISLREYAKSYSTQQLITDLIVNKHSFGLNNFKVFEELNRQGKFILIFDGFDEMAQRVDYGVVVDNFWEIAKVAITNSKVLLTCRSTHFREEKESRNVLGGKIKSTKITIDHSAGFDLIYIEEFNDEKIVQVIAKRIKDEQMAKQFWSKLKGIYDIPSIATKPVLIPMLVEVMPDILQTRDKILESHSSGQEKIKPAMIYNIYTNKWLNESISTGRTYLPSKWHKLFLMKELAWHMIKSQKLKIPYTEIPDFINAYLKPESKELEYLEYDLRNNSFLRRDQFGVYEFAHKSQAEFFVALKFAIELGVAKLEFIEGIEKENLTKLGIRELVASFGYLPLSPEISLFLQDMVADTKELKSIFNRCREFRGENTGFVGSNLITLLLTLGEPFDSEDLSFANIPGAFLKGAHISNCNFDNANLTKCQLEKAKLENSSFNKANLDGIQLLGANCSGIRGEGLSIIGANCEESNFSESDIPFCNMSRSQFANSELINCNLSHCIAQGTDFSGSDLSESDLSYSSFDDATFNMSNMKNTNLRGSTITKCTFHSTQMQGIKLDNCDLSGSILEHLEMHKVRFNQSKLNDASLIGADLSGCQFVNASLKHSLLKKCNLSRCNFENADLSGAQLSEADLSECNLSGTNLSNADIRRIDGHAIKINNSTMTQGIIVDDDTFVTLPKDFQNLIRRDNIESSS